MLENKRIGFFGVGNMSKAIIKGLLNNNPNQKLALYDTYQPSVQQFTTNKNIEICSNNRQVLEKSDVAIIAVKPNDVKNVLHEIKPIYEKHPILIISICAGVATQSYVESIPSIRIARVMPNINCLIQESATAFCLHNNCKNEDAQIVKCIFETVGTIYMVKEELLDAVTGLSGSGPAYIFYFIEGLIDAGVTCGLSRDVATGLAIQTMFGSVKLLKTQKNHPSLAKEMVTSPGGTTIHGLLELEKNSVKYAIMNAVRQATERSKQLSKM